MMHQRVRVETEEVAIEVGVVIVRQVGDPEAGVGDDETAGTVELLSQGLMRSLTRKMRMIGRREDLYDLAEIVVIDQDDVIVGTEMIDQDGVIVGTGMIAIVGIAETEARSDADQAEIEMTVDDDQDLVPVLPIEEEAIGAEVATGNLEKPIAT
jgi:hypothetical protein